MRIYGLKNCDTCRKAVKLLTEAGKEAELQDVRQSPLDREMLGAFAAAFGPELVNRRSTTWRNLDEAQRQADPLDLLTAHPALMKRPVIDDDGTLYLGWGKDVQQSLLG